MTSKNYPRKVIQVAALRIQGSGPDGSPPDPMTEVVALCDDGSIWTMFDTLAGEWVPLPKIPQGQLFEDWRDDVAACLVREHLIRRDALAQILEQHHGALVSGHSAGRAPVKAAEAVAASLK